MTAAADGEGAGDGGAEGRSSDAKFRAMLSEVKETKPTVVQGLTVHIDPKAAAGIQLSKIVLGLMTGALFFLWLYLLIMEFNINRDVSRLYGQIVNPNRVGAEVYVFGQIESMMADVRAAADSPDGQLSVTAQTNADKVVAMVDLLQGVSAADKTAIAACRDLPEGATRQTTAELCVNALESIRTAAIEASSGLADAEIVSKFAAQAIEQRESFHAFWIQAAQLILLNLLLPLLTGLFGYIFGTQQNGRAES